MRRLCSATEKSRTSARWLAGAGFCAWLAAVTFGGWQLVRYAAAEATALPAPSALPPGFAASDRAQLMMFIHPQCPCTRASISNLERLLARANGTIDATAVIVLPPGAPDDWTESASTRAVRAIPGVNVRIDRNGDEATRFGAISSGYVLLYNKERQLAFRGGITPARGHEGDCAGIDEILKMVNGGAAPATRDVFAIAGCALLDDPLNRKAPNVSEDSFNK